MENEETTTTEVNEEPTTPEAKEEAKKKEKKAKKGKLPILPIVIGVAVLLCVIVGIILVSSQSNKNVFSGRTLYMQSKGNAKFLRCDRCGAEFDLREPLNLCPKCGGLMVQKRGQNGTFVQCADPNCREILRRGSKKNDD